MRSLRKMLAISWMSSTTQTVVLSRCGLTTMFTMLRQRRLRPVRIPKDLLYRGLNAGKQNLGRPQLRYRDVRKRDMKDLSSDKNK